MLPGAQCPRFTPIYPALRMTAAMLETRVVVLLIVPAMRSDMASMTMLHGLMVGSMLWHRSSGGTGVDLGPRPRGKTPQGYAEGAMGSENGSEPPDPAADGPLRRETLRRPSSDLALILVALAAVAAALLVVGGGYWLVTTLKQTSDLQDCAMAGRRNCGQALPQY
jgi:hypothetical protein